MKLYVLQIILHNEDKLMLTLPQKKTRIACLSNICNDPVYA